MKMRIWTLLLCVALCLPLPMAVSAERIDDAEVKTALVIDFAGVLTADEVIILEEKAQRTVQAYQTDVAVLVMENAKGFYGSAFDKGMDLYEEMGIGYGADKSGILLFIDMSERDYAFVIRGATALRAFTDYGQIQIENAVVPYMSSGNYYQAFDVFIGMCDEYLALETQGNPVDTYVPSGSENVGMPQSSRKLTMEEIAPKVIGSVVIALLVALGICSMWAAQMKTAVKKTTAHDYIPKNGFALRNQSDMFLYRTQTRTRVQSSSSSSGGSRGGTSTNSRGYSGRSGKF